jgi:hypothetical protein
MTLAHDALSDLEALAYEAALEPSLWPQVAADASRAFEATYMMLRVADRRGKNVMHAAPPGFGELAEVIMARYSTVETNASFAFAALTPPAAVGCATELFPIPISNGVSSTRKSSDRWVYGTPRS